MSVYAASQGTPFRYPPSASAGNDAPPISSLFNFFTMITIVGYAPRQNSAGETFYTLLLQGGIEMVKSQTTGNYYATARRTSVTSTFDERTCKALIGEKLQGHVARMECESFDYTIQETGEVIKLNHRWVYVPEGQNEQEVIRAERQAQSNGMLVGAAVIH